MKYTAIILGVALMFGACSPADDMAATPELTSQNDSFSYYYGLMVGDDIKATGSKNFDSLDMDLLARGFVKALAENDAEPMNMEEVKTYFFARIDEIKMEQAMKEQAAAPSQEETNSVIEEWITANRNMDDFTKAPEGYYYREITAGSGAKPVATDRVSVHYTGTLMDGTVFDSSIPRGEPTEFGLNQVISGWTLGLQNMNEGSKYEFVLPPNLAYGSRAAGDIPANSTLIFEVELLKIVK